MDHAPHERHVLFLDLSIGELSRQFLMSAIILRHDHQARRAAIEPMDDAGPQFTADATQVLDVMEQGIHEGSTGMSGAGVNDHAGGFVEHDDVPILEHNPDRKCLWCRDRGTGWWNINVVLLASSHDSARAHGDGAADMSVLDEALHTGARLLREQHG